MKPTLTITWAFLALAVTTGSWFASCATIIEEEGVSVNLDQHNNGDNLPNNLQPFLPEENDAGGYIRALLCPDVPLEALSYFRFHLVTRMCYEVGTQGPCGQNMVFVKEPATKAIGKCVCVSPGDGSVVGHRPLLRDPVTNQCYPLFSQAFCPDGEWLVVNPHNHNHVYCEPNPCARVSVRVRRSVNISETSESSTSTSTSTSSEIPMEEIVLEFDDVVNSTETADTINITEIFIDTFDTDFLFNNDTSTSTSTSSTLSSTSTGMYENEDNGRLQQDEYEYVFFNGTCTRLDAYSEFCDPDQVLGFVYGGTLGCTAPPQQQTGNDNTITINHVIVAAVPGENAEERQEEEENLIHSQR